MDNLKERRKHQRYIAKDGVLAFHGGKVAQLINIGMGGLCFRYVRPDGTDNLGDQADSFAKIDIVSGRDDLFLNEVPVKRVADYRTALIDLDQNETARNYLCLRFGALTTAQLFHLQLFILVNAYGVTPKYHYA